MRARSEGEMGLYVSRICLSPGRAANSLQPTRAANLLLLVIPLAGCGETIANAPMSPSCEPAKLSSTIVPANIARKAREARAAREAKLDRAAGQAKAAREAAVKPMNPAGDNDPALGLKRRAGLQNCHIELVLKKSSPAGFVAFPSGLRQKGTLV